MRLSQRRCPPWQRLALVACTSASLAFGQSAASDEDYAVYSEAPRLILTKARLRLLQRERERKAMRWEQFDAMVAGGAAMPEPGFAWALYYRVAGDSAIGKKAVDWALSDQSKPEQDRDLRQLALVFDWCGPLMTPQQSERLAVKIRRGITPPPADFGKQPAQVFAAVAIADTLPDHGASALKALVEGWRKNLAGKLESGRPSVAREQTYALLEMLHALRDNLKLDLREDAPKYFKTLPTYHLVSHYPLTFAGPENEFRVPIYIRDGEPDLADAALSRAAELSMVAYDANEAENQFLQGWLMQDRFLLRGVFGVPYEFLWANPYQPGLSYFHAPLLFHDTLSGNLFARTTWDEDAEWVGYFDGHLQVVRDGKIQSLRLGPSTPAVRIGDAVILTAPDRDAPKFKAENETIFVIGLTPNATYDVEIDDQELSEAESDNGGTMVLTLPEGIEAGVRMKRRL
ncbi:MAG: hypothetical protein ABL967_09420 [Bryobacteraceae bacterium]